ncbi:hypothetical protein HMF7854_08445 [Sphingomonas ginkgonis]|uniref:5-bromo-4-chloroindolyl phosphate hydrolase n=1 Tax=Sphingomonas ginkgonis TaxID=2315330 RepID=A0A429VAB5_9SPHN|nr:hypothetical protein [Sphingomonas ginkgonis]RST30866.1 hypothetical protein HMF7854_08445 [Sphingomonas ginkgonis]
MTDQRVEKALARFERVTTAIDARGGEVAAARRRERQRINADFGRRAARVGIAVGLVSLVTIIVGLIMPIGMFGFLAAVGLAIGIAAVLAFAPGPSSSVPTVPASLANGEMVQRFDSFLYRSRPALPAPAQTVVDQISARLSPLRETLGRLPDLDPQAQDARRLMSVHLPGLVERYRNVPAAFRTEADGEGKTVDQRLVESLEAGRDALDDISQNLARADVDAFSTQGRFIQSRYGDGEIES